MVTRFEPARDLDLRMAQEVAPVVDRTLDRLRDLARAGAPPVNVWITARDERVRPTHVETDGQAVPDNLRFKVPSTHGFGHDLARYPRDPDLPLSNRINCRCQVAVVRDLLARTIHRTPVTVEGTRVSGEVYTKFPRAGESEVGNLPDDQPAHFMLDALRGAAASMGASETPR